MKTRLPLALEAMVVAGIACGVASGSAAQALGDCGDPFQNAFGPFDYRTAAPEQKYMVEIAGGHFTASVEALKSGTSGSVGGELSYTLRAFPNHPRALPAMVRLGELKKTSKPPGSQYSVECWLERAVQFRPDDRSVRLIRGVYYSKQRRYDRAIADFEFVIEQQPDNANAHYNLGLAYFEQGNYDGARAEAKRAAELGFPLHGLRDTLKAKGKWDE